MSDSDHKKSVKTNGYLCGCCFNGERNPKCKAHKKRVRRKGKEEIKKELENEEK